MPKITNQTTGSSPKPKSTLDPTATTSPYARYNIRLPKPKSTPKPKSILDPTATTSPYAYYPVRPSGSSTTNPKITPVRSLDPTATNSPYARYPVQAAQNISSGVTAVQGPPIITATGAPAGSQNIPYPRRTAVQGPPIITATGAPAGSQNIPYPNGTMYPDKKAPAVAPATNIRAAQVTSKTPTKTIGASTDVDDVQTMNQINAFNASIASLSSNVAKNTATIQQLAAQDQQARNQAQADALNAQYSSAATVDQTAAPAATPAPTGGISGFLSGTTGKIVVYGGIAAGAFFFARSRGLLK